jgi:RNA polymerase sigma-70 factor (ECF subfamily)
MRAARGLIMLRAVSTPDELTAARALRRATPAEIDAAIRRVLAGERAVYRTVIRAFEAPLRSLMVALLPAGLSTDDLVQETFIAAYQRLGEYPMDGTFFAWLRGLGRNMAVRERRRHLRRRALDRVYEREVEDPVTVWVEQRAGAIDDETAAQLRDCMSRLAETPRRVLERYYFQAAPVDRIAADERRLPSWVYLVMFRAREVLARCLERKARAAHV